MSVPNRRVNTRPCFRNSHLQNAYPVGVTPSLPIGLNLSIADLSSVEQASGHSAGRQGSRRMHWRGMIRGNAACCDLKHIPISLWLAALCSPCLRASVARVGLDDDGADQQRSKWGQVESSCIFQRAAWRG